VSSAPLQVAVLGAGTVGREVVRALLGRPEISDPPGGGPGLRLVGVAVRDSAKAVAAGIPSDLVSDTPAHLVASPETDVIVELMGGDEPARTLISAALGVGKAVVTANKHVLAYHGAELEAAARQSGAALRFEAAVGGGIPVLGPIAVDLAANRVTMVRGIVNGTTNFILSAMSDGARSYEAALREAQALGYAEVDPSGDIEGDDAVNKLVILARLAYGIWIDPSEVAVRPPGLHGPGAPGISGITSDAVAGAAALGLALRLVATAERIDPTGSIRASVVPTALPADTPLGATHGVLNRIEITAEPVGVVGFDGPGAGGPATSSAVLGDLLAVARDLGSTWATRPAATRLTDASVVDGFDAERAWYVFLPGTRPGGGLDEIGQACAERPTGLALLTRPMALDLLRQRVQAAVEPAVDVAFYPAEA